jgi:hypothetical protein
MLGGDFYEILDELCNIFLIISLGDSESSVNDGVKSKILSNLFINFNYEIDYTLYMVENGNTIIYGQPQKFQRQMK